MAVLFAISQGKVDLAAVVTAAGDVRDIRVLRSLEPDLDAQAVNAARHWRFRPASKDGKPVDMDVVIQMRFTR